MAIPVELWVFCPLLYVSGESTLEKEEISTRPSLFLSYHWDVQNKVQILVKYLESHGFQCWTDVSNANRRYAIGHAPDPADSLQIQIQRKIKAAVAVVCCVTPKYICSENCTKDLSIAESMKKPIVPVMLQWLAWPPEGGRARRILAPLSCIDMSNNNLFKRNLSTFEIYLKKCANKHNTWWFRRTKWVHFPLALGYSCMKEKSWEPG